MTSRQVIAADVRYARQQKRLAKYYWKLSVKTKSETYARICLSTANHHASMLRPFNPPPSAQEVENIFAILDNPAHTAEEWDAACLAIWAPLADEPAETPLTPSQLEAEALSDLQAIALECDMAIRQHIADDGHLTDKANKEARLIRAEARRIVAGFTTWLDRDALRAA